MKRLPILVTLLTILVYSGAVHAQFSLGARVAANVSSLVQSGFDEEDEEVLKNHRGIALGMAFEASLSSWFALQTELLYSQYGTTWEDNYSFSVGNELYEVEDKEKIRMHYIQLPILAKAKLDMAPLGIEVLAGPYLGYGMGRITLRYEDETRVNGVLLEKEKDIERVNWDEFALSRFDFGLLGGLGISLPLGPGRLGLDARYQLGLTNLYEDGDDGEKITNRNMQVGLSYMIPIGR